MAGIRVYNNAGYVQIDGEYKNLRLTAQGTLALSNPPTSTEFAVPPTTAFFNASTPVVAVRADVHVVVYVQATAIPGLFQVGVIAEAAGTAEYYVFDQVPPSTMGTTGARVYAPDGSLVYNSNDNSLRVVDIVQQGSMAFGASVDRNYGTRKIAVVTAGQVRRQDSFDTGGSGSQKYAVISTAVGTRVTSGGLVNQAMTIVAARRNASIVTYASSRLGSHLMVDVTGY